MSTIKISQLPSITGANADGADVLPLVDTSLNVTNKITREEFFLNVPAVSVNGNLTVDTNTLFVDAVNNRVGLGTASPSVVLDVVGAANISGDLTVADKIVHSGDTNTSIRFPAADTVTVETSGSERVRVDSTGKVGIGTNAPATTLDVNGDVTITDKIIHSGDTNTCIRFPVVDVVAIETNGSERLRVDSSGNLLVGTASGSNTLTVDGTVGGTILATQAEAEAGTNNTKLMTPLRVAQAARPVFSTSVSPTSGVLVDFTSIPSWARRVSVLFTGMSTSGTSGINLRLGTASAFATTGYTAARSSFSASAVTTSVESAGFFITNVGDATALITGRIDLVNAYSNTWVASGNYSIPNLTRATIIAGFIDLSDVLTRIRLISSNGTDTFDAGTINISWE